MFQFLFSMLLALHTFPCFLSPFVWSQRNLPAAKFSGLLNLLQVQLLHHPLACSQPVPCQVPESTAGLQWGWTGWNSWAAQAGCTGSTWWSQRSFPAQEILAFCAGAQGHAHLEKGEQEFHIELGRANCSVKPKIPHEWMGMGWCSPCQQHHWKVVGVGLTSSSQECLKSQFTLVLFGCSLQPSSTPALFRPGSLFSCTIADPLSSSSSSQVCCSSFTCYFLFMVPVELNGLKWMVQPKPQCWGLGLIWFLLHWTSLGLCDQEWAKPRDEDGLWMQEPWGMISSACQPCSWTASGWGSLIKACVN